MNSVRRARANKNINPKLYAIIHGRIKSDKRRFDEVARINYSVSRRSKQDTSQLPFMTANEKDYQQFLAKTTDKTNNQIKQIDLILNAKSSNKETKRSSAAKNPYLTRDVTTEIRRCNKQIYHKRFVTPIRPVTGVSTYYKISAPQTANSRIMKRAEKVMK